MFWLSYKRRIANNRADTRAAILVTVAAILLGVQKSSVGFFVQFLRGRGDGSRLPEAGCFGESVIESQIAFIIFKPF